MVSKMLLPVRGKLALKNGMGLALKKERKKVHNPWLWYRGKVS
jgi:hypothetical protein